MSAPWVAGGLCIPKAVIAEVERAARAAYARDEEACGYLEGPLTEPLAVDRAVDEAVERLLEELT